MCLTANTSDVYIMIMVTNEITLSHDYSLQKRKEAKGAAI